MIFGVIKCKYFSDSTIFLILIINSIAKEFGNSSFFSKQTLSQNIAFKVIRGIIFDYTEDGQNMLKRYLISIFK